MLVVAHRDLPEDDLPLHLGVLVGDERIEDHVGDRFHRRREAFLRSIDVIDRAVEGRVGVGGPAAPMDRLGQFPVGEATRALEHHMLEIMGDARTLPTAFVNAAGAHPGLHGAKADARAMGIDDLEPVRQHAALGHGTGDLGEAEAFE